jgi:hypothetical protein
MAKAGAKTSTINRSTPGAHLDLSSYCRDLAEWPRSWMGFEKDLQAGEKLVACFRPFLEHLAASSLSRKTIRKHVDNLWVLGGEIIRDLNENPALRKRPGERILLDLIDDEGGPLIHGCDSEEAQRSLDSTCRKLRRFLSQQSS